MEIKRIVHNLPARDQRLFYGTVRMILCLIQQLRRVLSRQCHFRAWRSTAWHTHPLGQTLIVTAGCGRHSAGRPDRRNSAG